MDLCKVECNEGPEGVYQLRISGAAGPDAAAELRSVAMKALADGRPGRMVIDLEDAESMHAAVMQVLLVLNREVELAPAGTAPSHLVEPLTWCDLGALIGGAAA
jgi:hypothetical protein